MSSPWTYRRNGYWGSFCGPPTPGQGHLCSASLNSSPHLESSGKRNRGEVYKRHHGHFQYRTLPSQCAPSWPHLPTDPNPPQDPSVILHRRSLRTLQTWLLRKSSFFGVTKVWNGVRFVALGRLLPSPATFLHLKGRKEYMANGEVLSIR